MSITIIRNPAIGGAVGGGASPDAVAAAVLASLPPQPSAYDIAQVVAASMPAQVSAYSGETRLFALQAGQTAPAGWTVDTQREVPVGLFASVTGLVAGGKAASSYNLTAVQLGDYLYQTTSSGITKTRLSDGVTVATFSHGQSYTQGFLPSLCAVGTGLVMVGGSTGSGGQMAVYQVNVDTGVFTRLADMPAIRLLASLAAIDSNRFLIVGGYTNATGEAGPFDTVWLYNISARTCTLVGNLATAASYVRTARLPSGNVLLLGGMNGSRTSVNTYQVFNASTSTVSTAKSIPVAYQLNMAREAIAFRTVAGVGYMAGGIYSTTPFAEYNETTDSFSSFQGQLPSGYRIDASGSTTSTLCTDLQASSYGHIIPTNGNYPAILIGSGYAPTYRYCRKN